MKIKLRRKFKYTWDNKTVHELLPGEYEVPRQIDEKAAKLALSFGAAIIIPESKGVVKRPKFRKKAPENKVVKVKRTK